MANTENNVPGFDYYPGWSYVPAQAIIEALPWSQPEIRVFGKSVKVPRLTCWMGEATYTYSGHTNQPVPMPAVISNLRDKLEYFCGVQFNSVLANYYRDGSDSVAWHADDEPELGSEPVIASLSFGGSRKFSVKERATGQTHAFRLSQGDLMVMSGRSQLDYLHSVPKTKAQVAPRVNLTFRYVKP